MSFQHFRLGQLSMATPLPPHLMNAGGSNMSVMQGTAQNLSQSAPQFAGQVQNNTNGSTSAPQVASAPATHQTISSTTPSKAPYGSGDSDDGYTLIFPNIAAFQEWRQREEETQMVEFVKGDTHGSKAVPPRFKDHTKLVCARHSRSGRKKYVKKHPERVRKVPSRKIEGIGCPASISYKTYYDTDEVRACYNSEHSHEIGLANLPFTKRGRKALAQQEKSTPRKRPSPSPASASASVPPVTPATPFGGMGPPPIPTPFPQPPPPPFQQAPQLPFPPPPHQFAPPLPFNQPQPGHSQERWDNMAALFASVRENARAFEYHGASIAALETVLLRLYFETPMPMGQNHHQQIGMMPPPPNGALPQHHQHQQQPMVVDNQQKQDGMNHDRQGDSSDEDSDEEE